MTHDRGQDVVEIVGEATGHGPDGLKSLRMGTLDLQVLPFLFRELALGDVPVDTKDLDGMSILVPYDVGMGLNVVYGLVRLMDDPEAGVEGFQAFKGLCQVCFSLGKVLRMNRLPPSLVGVWKLVLGKVEDLEHLFVPFKFQRDRVVDPDTDAGRGFREFESSLGVEQ